jgi:DNA-binding XRE family transcriptional regulator
MWQLISWPPPGRREPVILCVSEKGPGVALKRLRLIQRRKALGYTQEALAEQLGCERTTVIRWERAETEPQPWLRPRLVHVLQLTAEELNELLADVADVPSAREGFTLVTSVPLDFSLSAAYTVRIMEGFAAHDIASRREALADLAIITGAALLRPVRQWATSLALLTGSPPEVGTDEVAELEQAVTLFRRWDASGAGGLRRKAVVGQLNAVAETLGEHNPPAITRRLFQVTAELAQLSGWMAYDQGLFGVAQRYYLLALHACRESSSPDLGAKIIGDMTQLSTALGHYEDSLTMVRTALYSLPRYASSLVRSELLGLESRAYAQIGENQTGNADRSAQTCVAVYDEAPQGEPAPDWIHYMNQAEVDCLAANTYIELALHATTPSRWQHYATRAEVHSLRARQARSEGYVRSRVFDEIRVAKVRLAQREPAESAAVGMHALELATETRSSLVVNWLNRFSRDLTGRHPDVPEVALFGEQARNYIRKAAPARAREL